MKKLFIDYEICHRCPECVVRCSNLSHPLQKGIPFMKEKLAFLFACRRCENYPCVNACPNGALTREEGIIVRSSLLCVSCKTCALACPFGTIVPDMLLYTLASCDLCVAGREKEKDRFSCVKSCPNGALKIVSEDDVSDKNNLHFLGDSLIVHVVDWLQLYGVQK